MVAGPIVTVIEAAWMLSTVTIPAILLLFLGLYGLQYRETAGTWVLLVRGQRDMILRHGPYIVAGIVAGGLLMFIVGGTAGFLLGGATVAAGVVAGLRRAPLPAPDTVAFQDWRASVHVIWAGVPVLAAAAVAFQHPLLSSVTALVFYGTIFWEL